MKTKIVKKIKLKKDVKISIAFVILVYLQFTAIIRGLELNDEIIIFGSVTLIDMVIGMLLMISKEK